MKLKLKKIINAKFVETYKFKFLDSVSEVEKKNSIYNNVTIIAIKNFIYW